MNAKIHKIITQVESEHPYRVEGDRDSYSDYNQGWADACDMIRTKLAKNIVTDEVSSGVVGQSEQYCEHEVTDQKTLRCTCCEECGEILDVLD